MRTIVDLSTGNVTTAPDAPAYQPTQADLTAALRQQANAILNQKTMERIQRAVIAGRTTWATPDVVAYCAFLDKVQAIATGKDTTSGTLPVPPTNANGSIAYPART